MDIITYFTQLASTVPHVIILVATIILLTCKKGIVPPLMFMGALVNLLASIIYQFLIPYLIESNMVEVNIYSSPYFIIINIIHIGAYACFAVGLLLWVLETKQR